MRNMRFLGAVAPLALLAGLIAGPAAADVYVLADVYKDKDVTVTETLDTNVDVDIEVDIKLDPTKGSKSLSLLNQRGEVNYTEEDYYSSQSATLSESVLENNGLTNLNQAAGHQNSQGNSISAAYDPYVPQDGGFAGAQASAEQQNNLNEVSSLDTTSSASIGWSINKNEGITSVNQAAGHQNLQGNGIAMAMAFGVTGVALAESDLGQFNTENIMYDSGGTRSAEMSGSMNHNMGITSANQAAGSQNNQANLVTFAAVTTGGF